MDSTRPPSPLAVITNHLSVGGAERLTLALTTAWAAQGIEVHLAAQDGDLRHELHPEVRFQPMPLHHGRALSPTSLLRLGRWLRAIQPRVILAHSAATTVAARAVCPTTPVVTLAHGWPDARYLVVAPMLRAASHVVAVSEGVMSRLIDAGLPPRALSLIPNGIDLDTLHQVPPPQVAAARRALGGAVDDIVAIHVGRLVAQKRQERLIAAAAALSLSHPRLRWVIVGDGPRRQELAAQITQAGLTDRVQLLGTRSDVPALLLAADLYVSTSDWEGLSLATIEAMAAGLAVVATDVPGTRELLGGGVGVVVPVGDAGKLQAEIGRLVDQEPERLRIGSLARARAQQRFSLDGQRAQLDQVLTRVAR